MPRDRHRYTPLREVAVAVAGGGLGAVLGLRVTMWVMTGLLVACGALLPASPVRTERDLPSGPADAGRIVR
ncbi:hypothetical protein [Kitasatospora sp. NPDC056181]|uniref:hypothetical protein n=1 Tax=Kitasatospora sp. NPDC056181 TaxID=3345737 RepID=UPI0035E0F089